MFDYDCVIVGGGVVGASLALALTQSGCRILMLEKSNAPSHIPSDFESRTIALSYASFYIFSQLGLWDEMASRAVPIKQVRVSVEGQFGSSRLKAKDQNLPNLGYVVSAHELEKALFDQLRAHSVKVLKPATLLSKQNHSTHWQLTISHLDQTFTCNTGLLVAADGMHSLLRDEQSIGNIQKEYGHQAVLANVRRESVDPLMAIERFLPAGAIALIPWQKDIATCIWTADKNQASQLMAMNDADFKQTCQQRLGSRSGTISAVGKRLTFPLNMKVAKQQIGSRFLLMGNAAHSLHPIAAQGLNLSLRDIWQLRKQWLAQPQADMGCEIFLHEYAKARASDQTRVIMGTDQIAQWMLGGLLTSPIRALGITLFDFMTPIKRQFTRLSMGIT